MDSTEIPSLVLLTAKKIAVNPQLAIQNHADGFLILPIELRELIWSELRKTGNLLEHIELFNLTKIDLSEISTEKMGVSTLTYHTIKRIAQKCPELEELNIQGCHLASPEESLELEQNKRLEALEQLKKNYPLHYETLMADEKRKPEKSESSSTFWNNIWLYLKKLMYKEPNPPPETLMIIPSNPEMVTSLAQFPKLRVLNIASCQGSINDVTVQEFIECCPKLQSFAISYCTHISDHALIGLKKRNSLVSLSVAYCWRITDGMLLEILKKNPVAHLDVSGMIMLQPRTIAKITTHNLVSLNLSGVACVGNAEIIALAKNAASIRSLNLSGCNNLQSDSILKLVQSCVDLEELDLTNIRSLGMEVLDAIADHLPNLQSLKMLHTKISLGTLSKEFQKLSQQCPQLIHLCFRVSSLHSAITESLAGNRLVSVTIDDENSSSRVSGWSTAVVGVIDAFPYLDTLTLNSYSSWQDDIRELQKILESTYPNLTVKVMGHRLGKKWKHQYKN